MCTVCQIVPQDVLRRFAKDASFSSAERKVFTDTARLDSQMRRLRTQSTKISQLALTIGTANASAGLVATASVALTPAVVVYDCKTSTTLPGVLVSNPGGSADVTAQHVFKETTSLAKFYAQVFGRNSIDNSGMTMLSSIHYGVKYNNAFWNGTQMTYGDGDGAIFIDFSRGNDVIGHELTHGVTQHSLQLNYTNESGGLNESISDCFGSMFRQWEGQQSFAQADWLIGADIMGPMATARGYTCLRDMADPAATHCLAPQPKTYSGYQPGMDPHYSSGIPNFAFYNVCKAVQGNSWDKPGQIWYKALTGFGPKPNMTMQEFANQTRSVSGLLYPGDAVIGSAVDKGWKQVGL